MSTEPTRIDQGRHDLVCWEEAKPKNFFSTDENFQRVLQMHLPAQFDALKSRLEQTGKAAATQMDWLARQANRDENLPTLARYDGVGQATETVVFSGAHHELGQLIWQTGALSLLGEPGQERACGAVLYLVDHDGEAGHVCPIACTAGLIKLLQQVGSPEQKERYLPALLDPDYQTKLHASQFVTEVQGGSDVGSNDCRAVPATDKPGWYRISGEKWFCSVMDAPLFVMTARPQGAPAQGTPGLGLFLVPREIEGKPNGLQVRRLKYKLGTRSLPSGEADFVGALGQPLGPLENGFKQLISIVLDTSRVHNAVAAAAFIRRAYVEAQTFARHRQAFGRPIIQFPAIQRTLARMKVQAYATLASTFRILALSDRLVVHPSDQDATLRAARRTHVNINKYWTSTWCTSAVRDGIEVLGGNGTIEEFSVLPRLYRDAIVLESWEGSHNTLCAQVLRDFRQRQMHRAWLKEVEQTLEAVGDHPAVAPHRQRTSELLLQVTQRIQRLVEGDELFAAEHVRPVVDQMCLVHAYVSLLTELAWEKEKGLTGEKEKVVQLFRLLWLDQVDPMDDPQVGQLQRELSATL